MQSPSLQLHQQASEDDHPKNREIKMELSNLSSRRKHTLNVGDPGENQVLMTSESNVEMMSLQVGSTQMETPQNAQMRPPTGLTLVPQGSKTKSVSRERQPSPKVNQSFSMKYLVQGNDRGVPANLTLNTTHNDS